MGGVIKPGMKRELLRSGYSYGVRITRVATLHRGDVYECNNFHIILTWKTHTDICAGTSRYYVYGPCQVIFLRLTLKTILEGHTWAALRLQGIQFEVFTVVDSNCYIEWKRCPFPNKVSIIVMFSSSDQGNMPLIRNSPGPSQI